MLLVVIKVIGCLSRLLHIQVVLSIFHFRISCPTLSSTLSSRTSRTFPTVENVAFIDITVIVHILRYHGECFKVNCESVGETRPRRRRSRQLYIRETFEMIVFGMGNIMCSECARKTFGWRLSSGVAFKERNGWINPTKAILISAFKTFFE